MVASLNVSQWHVNLLWRSNTDYITELLCAVTFRHGLQRLNAKCGYTPCSLAHINALFIGIQAIHHLVRPEDHFDSICLKYGLKYPLNILFNLDSFLAACWHCSYSAIALRPPLNWRQWDSSNKALTAQCQQRIYHTRYVRRIYHARCWPDDRKIATITKRPFTFAACMTCIVPFGMTQCCGNVAALQMSYK